MLVWVVLTETLHFASEGYVIDKQIGPAAVFKDFEKALEYAEMLNEKLINSGTKRIEVLNGEIIWTNNYVHKKQVYLK